MLLLSQLKEFLVEVKASLTHANNNPMFGFVDMVIDDSELSNLLKERSEGDNSMLIAIVPTYGMKGKEDNLRWTNILRFFILDKTAYSEHDKESYQNIFIQTQIKAVAFAMKLIEEKANSEDNCGIWRLLIEDSIAIDPVWRKNDCNGWMIDIDLETNL